MMLFQIRIRHSCIDIRLLTEGMEKFRIVTFVEAVHDLDSAFVYRKIHIDHLLEIQCISDTQSITGRTRTLGRVERKAHRLKRLETDLAVKTRQMLRIVNMGRFQTHLFRIEHFKLHLTVALLERFFYILTDTVTALIFDHDTVDDRFYCMFLCLGELDLFIQAHHYAVYHRADIAFVAQRLYHIGKGSFFFLRQRS